MKTPGAARTEPRPATQWPAVFDGIGALVVNCALDPDQLADKIPGLTWIAVKRGGTDVAPDSETMHAIARWRQRGLLVGTWVYCVGPPSDDVAIAMGAPWSPDCVVWDVEAPYKADEGGHYEYSAQLVARVEGSYYSLIPQAVTSYGGYKTSIDFAAFARAGWPIFAQSYDSFEPADAISYATKYGGVYPLEGVHNLLRQLRLGPSQAVYRPESID
jgi:hypothetical protein